MSIAKVVVKNFRGVRFVEFVPDKVNVLTGRNGTGKTTVLEAINKVLSVSALSAADITPGEKKCEIALSLDDEELRITRTSSACSFFINGKKNSQKTAKEWVLAKTGASADAYAALGGQKVFDGMSTKDMTKLFFAILPMTQKKADVVALVDGFAGGLSDKEKKVLEDTLPADIGDAEVKAAYKTMFENRRDAGRDARAYAGMAPTSPLPSETVDELKKAKEDADNAIAEAKAAVYMRTAYERAAEARKRAESRKAELIALKEALPDGKEVPSADIAKWQEERQKFVDAISRYEGHLSGARANVKSLREMLSSVQSNACPLSKSIRCATDKTALIKGLEANIAAFDKRIKEYEDFIPKCRQQVAMRDTKLAEADAERRKADAVKSMQRDIDNVVIPEMPEKPADVTVDVDELSRKRADADAKLAIIGEHERYKSVAQKAEEKQVMYNIYDKLLPFFADNGQLRTEIISRAVAVYERACNERAEKIRKGFAVRFCMDDGVSVQASPHGGVFVDMANLSTGEFAIASYLLMAVIAMATKANILFMDSMDAMDSKSFAEFMDVVLADKAAGQVFIACADHDDTLRHLASLNVNIVEMK